ncbi:MAG TPA: hypothetical protein VL593_00590 [Ramlibacter sp.]|nr:hypothetical protein [Ramlibacter sp.]
MTSQPTGANPIPFKKFSALPNKTQIAARGLVGTLIAASFIAVWLPRDHRTAPAASKAVQYVTLPRVEIVGQREHAPDVVAQAVKLTAHRD